MYLLITVCLIPFVIPKGYLNDLLLLASISPDGRTLLSVGDSSKIYFHHMRGGEPVTFEHIHDLLLPPPDSCPILYPSALAASFSTAFSSDGMKFAVASQEGVLAVWDIRSTKPIKVIQTDKSRWYPSEGGFLSDDPTDWTRGRSPAPGFSVRSVKFGSGGASGKEIMTFTEVRPKLGKNIIKCSYPLLLAHISATRCRCADF